MSRLLKSRDYLMNYLGLLLLLGFISLGAIGGCNNNGGDANNGEDADNGEDAMEVVSTILNIINKGDATTVFAQPSPGSCTTISDWSTNSPISCTSGDTNCTVTINATICSFPIAKDDTCTLPLKSGCSSNIKLAFNSEYVTNPCGATSGTGPSVAEIVTGGGNCSKTPGCDTPPCDCADISLVQGYKLPNISMVLSDGPTTLGPTVGATGNQNVFGVYPVGCTNCVNRGGCPCDIDCKEMSQCHQGGTPEDPDLPCQASQPTGGTITINILAN